MTRRCGDPGAPVFRNRRLLLAGVSDCTGASTVDDVAGESSVDGTVYSATGKSSIGELTDEVEWESMSVLIRSNIRTA